MSTTQPNSFDLATGPPAIAAAPPQGLSSGHFRRVSMGGFGDGQNSYAYAYTWFNGHVYIGTARNILVVIRKRFTFEVPMAQWPVEVPDEIDPEQLCGELWRYSPTRGVWERCYHSTLTTGIEGAPAPVATGFRNMAVFQGRSDASPCIYTIPSCGSKGAGVVLMRCEDGLNFEVVSEPGMGLEDKNLASFRGVLAFKDQLFATPSGSRGANPNVSYNSIILCSDDPRRGGWQASNAPMFGELTNYGIHDMAVCGDWLYAGTMNIRGGCQIWKTRAEGPPPHHWTKVLDLGADRGAFNQTVVCMREFNGALYVGTGIQNGGHDRTHHVGPGAGEVFRVYPDDTFDLVMGQPRQTRHGFKIPSSGMGPGFDNPFAGYIWRMGVHDGSLYVGTYDSSSFMPFANLKPSAQRVLDPATLELFMQHRAGCELWRTSNGDDWTPVTRNGFGNRYNFGVRTILPTPHGLFVGTANPFGPRVAVRTATGWRYEDNPQGGTEIWQGRLEFAGLTSDQLPAEAIEVNTGWPLAKRVTPGEAALRLPEIEPGVQQWLSGGEQAASFLSELAEQALPESLAPGQELVDEHLVEHGLNAEHPSYSFDDELRRRAQSTAEDPVYRLSGASKSGALPVGDVAREVDGYFAGSVLRNVGYWRSSSLSPHEASRLLAREVLDLLPTAPPSEAVEGAAREILVIGAGGAEIAQEVLQLQPRASVSVLVSTRDEARAVAATAPGVGTLRTHVRKWSLPAAKFDAIVWIEALAPADRARGLTEARRALKPGGVLAGADLLGSDSIEEPRHDSALRSLAGLFSSRDAAQAVAPTSNVELPVPAPTEAERKFDAELAAGDFAERRVVDITSRAWLPFFRHSRTYFLVRLMLLHLEKDQYDAMLAALPGRGLVVEGYLLFRAQKPRES